VYLLTIILPLLATLARLPAGSTCLREAANAAAGATCAATRTRPLTCPTPRAPQSTRRACSQTASSSSTRRQAHRCTARLWQQRGSDSQQLPPQPEALPRSRGSRTQRQQLVPPLAAVRARRLYLLWQAASGRGGPLLPHQLHLQLLLQAAAALCLQCQAMAGVRAPPLPLAMSRRPSPPHQLPPAPVEVQHLLPPLRPTHPQLRRLMSWQS
jgi:hypothetical protein